MGRVKLNSYPYLLQIEPICGCNLKCPLCPVGNNTIKRKRGVMSYENYVKIMKKIEDHIIHISFWNWGEPLLNKDIFRMISYAKQKKIHTVLATNGYYVTKDISRRIIKSGLDEIKISLDGASRETYERYRKNSDFNKVLENISYLIKEKNRMRNKLRVSLQFIVMKHNQHEIGKMKKISKKVNADYLSIKTVSTHGDQKNFREFIPDKEDLSRYHLKKGEAKPIEKKKCYFPWRILVNWEGTVTVCCLDFNAKYGLGNILKKDLKPIWNGEGYKKFRRAMLKDRNSIDLCKKCSTSQERFIE
ncbi:radical SAM protein [Candidatus Woesearchaeota archaeon]|nr:radical SAM protein [Candidatus Woesearchaeota archaeon]